MDAHRLTFLVVEMLIKQILTVQNGDIRTCIASLFIL